MPECATCRRITSPDSKYCTFCSSRIAGAGANPRSSFGAYGCHACQHPSDASFCRDCGSRLTVVDPQSVEPICNRCGKTIPTRVKFCSVCGGKRRSLGRRRRLTVPVRIVFAAMLMILIFVAIAALIRNDAPVPSTPLSTSESGETSAQQTKSSLPQAEPITDDDRTMIEATAIRYFRARYSEVGAVQISIAPQGNDLFIIHGYANLDLGPFGGVIRRDLVCQVKQSGGRWFASDVESTDPLSEKNLERYLNQPEP